MSEEPATATADLCRMDWPAFDLESPQACDCPHPAAYRVTQACVHEHVQESLVCERHLDVMQGYYPLAAWGCARCNRDEPRHLCIAPVTVSPLEQGAIYE